ncbi:isocitrate lyase/PEP mutase family protein [Actinomadura algeriensis]|uniref:Methylisocitrate lyase n=1 Tax=Actinomadura algeriensis TaxID=1679523 RepID=A0ABR9JR13_9ACTN|nr:isocitrate lyase/PEP mutase family protein [Actinomadura algeriensis]MBE1533001.1 methylisocitrate lyase [Actinomadura algeriensis]
MTAANRLRDLMADDVVYAPGVWDGLTARLAEQAGFPALCASGFAISAALGLPDAELYTMSENLDAVRRIIEASGLPVIADIDTGYGNAVNAARTARRFADAGVAAVFMEDQESPKRCPICVGDPVPVIGVEEAAGKIRAVRDAVGDRLVVIARTDTAGREALERAETYAAAGAEMIMPVTKTFASAAEWRECRDRVGVPLMATLTASTWVERDLTPDVLREVGVRLALLPTQILLSATGAMRETLRRLRSGEPPAQVSADALPHHDFVDLIGFADVEKAQETYLPAATA